MDYRISYLLYHLCMMTSLFIIGLDLLAKVLWLGIVGLVIFFAGMLQAALFYRCPYCGKSLNLRGRKPSYCPECGEPLDL